MNQEPEPARTDTPPKDSHDASPSLRRRVRDAALEAARWVGWLRACENRKRGELTILTYHRVLPDELCPGYPFASLVMPASMFTQQVAWLSEHAVVLPVAEALDVAGKEHTRPLVAISFDDGYGDNAEIAAPILERHGLRATFFLASDFVGKDEWMWYDHAVLQIRHAADGVLASAAKAQNLTPLAAAATREEAWIEALKGRPAAGRRAFLALLPETPATERERPLYRAMKPQQAAALARAGHEIGSHSVSHEILPLASNEELKRELSESRARLQDWTGAPIVGFCYPNGSHDERVVDAVRQTGYHYACTTLPPRVAPRQDPMRLGRRDLTPGRVSRARGGFHLTAFRAELAGLLDGLR